jgi:hypothetical protein
VCRVVAQSCGVRALNARMCERVRGPSSEADLTRGGAQPSSEADLARGGVQAGHGGHQGRDRVVCVFWLRG